MGDVPFYRCGKPYFAVSDDLYPLLELRLVTTFPARCGLVVGVLFRDARQCRALCLRHFALRGRKWPYGMDDSCNGRGRTGVGRCPLLSEYAGTKLGQQRFYDLPQLVGYGHVDARCASPAVYRRMGRQLERWLLHRSVGGRVCSDDPGDAETP